MHSLSLQALESVVAYNHKRCETFRTQNDTKKANFRCTVDKKNIIFIGRYNF